MLFFFLFWEGTIIVGRGVGTEITVYLVCYLKILLRLDLPPPPLPLPLPPSWGPQPLPMIVTFRLDFYLSLSLFGEECGLISWTATGNRAYKVTSCFVMVYSVHAQRVTQTKESWNNDLAVEVLLDLYDSGTSIVGLLLTKQENHWLTLGKQHSLNHLPRKIV